jgi:hypothetical protein
MCKTRQNLVACELITRILIGLFNVYTVISNGTIMLTQNELQKYLILSNIVSGSTGIVLTYINESLKNQISNYDDDKKRHRVSRIEKPIKKLNSWIPFIYSM